MRDAFASVVRDARAVAPVQCIPFSNFIFEVPVTWIMRLIFWVTALLAVLSVTCAKNSTTKAKPKRQLESLRTPETLQYSLVLPHSRVTQFRSLTSERRISHASPRAGKLPPYAVQMEPVVQYSQKDPLYDRSSVDSIDDTVVNQNQLYVQPKVANVQDQDTEGTYGSVYGTLPTAPLYSQEPHHHPHYYEAPEPIIEIIIKESNESLPAPPPPPVQKKKKEPVHVFYVKYSKDPHHKDKVIYEKPIPAITPPTNVEDEHQHEYVTVTPEPYHIPVETTTLRALIKPESEQYHSDSSVRITFGNEGHHYNSERRESHEDHEETAPRPAIAHPQQPPTYPPLARSASVAPQPQEHQPRPSHPTQQTYRQPVSQHAQSRITFQQPYITNEQQLPRQAPSVSPFRSQGQVSRQSSFGPSPSVGPVQGFSNNFGSFGNVGPTIPGPSFPSFPRQTFQSRPSNQPPFGTRQHFNGPPRSSFHSGPQRPFYQTPQPYFDEPKYLQENYHTITTDQADSPKEQLLPNRPQQNFNFGPRPSPSPAPSHFQDSFSRPQFIPLNQQLPQQRPPQNFVVSPSNSPFFNLKPSPPQIEPNHQQFQQPQQQQFSFHQGPRPAHQNSLQGPIAPSPSPVSPNQFLPQPSSPTLFNFHPQPSPAPEQQSHFQHGPSERPQYNQNNLQDISNYQHQQNLAQFVPNGGELISSIPKYEQHITVNGPTAQPNYSGLSETSQPTPTASAPQQQYQQVQHQYHQVQQQQQQQQQYQQVQQVQQPQPLPQQEQQPQPQYFDEEQEQVRLQLAQNVKKQQEEIQRLQTQLRLTQQQHSQQQQQTQQYVDNYQRNNYQQEVQATSPKSQYSQEKTRHHASFVSSTSSPPYYQPTSRTVDIKPTTQKYVSSTLNSINTSPDAKKDEKKTRPAVELPDEVPDDLRQQLLSSGILDNADISVLDYDKVGETPLDSLPPDQLANFFSAGGGQQIAASEHRPIVVSPNGDRIQSRIDDEAEEDDQEIAASENIPSYVVAPPSTKQAVEMKVVHFNPKTLEGQKIAKDYVKADATQIDPVILNDKKFNRYLPLKVSGNQFPLPDILKGRKVTSVVVLAPVETEALNGDHARAERAATDLKGIKFIAGATLKNVLKRPTKSNFEKWLENEKKTAADLQSVILLVTGNDNASEDREIYMYEISSGKVNKLSGDLSNAFVDAAENNSLSKDIEKLAIAGEGVPEPYNRETERSADASENVPFLVDLSGVSLDDDKSNQVSISSGYSKTKLGRSLRRP